MAFANDAEYQRHIIDTTSNSKGRKDIRCVTCDKLDAGGRPYDGKFYCGVHRMFG